MYQDLMTKLSFGSILYSENGSTSYYLNDLLPFPFMMVLQFLITLISYLVENTSFSQGLIHEMSL
jgi:hypothetical protein